MKQWLNAILVLCAVLPAAAQESKEPEKQFNQLCQGCHGQGGAGGDRAPALVNNRDLRTFNEARIAEIIQKGTPGGMPAFSLPAKQLQSLVHWLHSLNSSAFESQPAGDAAAGQVFFFGRGQCGTCHMVRGRGKANGPDLSGIGRKATIRELELVLDNPTSQMGIHTTPTCPPWAFCADETWSVVDVHLRDSSTLRGFARNRSEHDLQLQTFDGKFHLLADTEYREIVREKQSYMPPLQAAPQERRDLIAYLSTLGGSVQGPLRSETEPVAEMRPQPGEWTTYNGVPGANRQSELTQINTQNVKNLQLRWIHSLKQPGLETTPLVSEGVMYVTAPDGVCALDARTGHEIWCYARAGEFRAANRGAALLGDRIFFTTADAHLICLHRLTGAVLWDINMPETPGHYSGGSAPLVVGDLVVAGVAGGDGPLRGFLAAYKATTGERAWRFWTIPSPGDPAAATWQGKAIVTGGGATWFTGSYDAAADTVYWAVGNPFPATDGDERGGANLYTNCVIALAAKTGELRWHFQFTPHDLHDWDATEPLVLLDTKYQGREAHLLAQANRNGFFYVLDRTNGKLLLAKPFIKKLNWASGIGPDGTPQLLPANQPTKAGVKTCPAVRGATNWYSTAFNPTTRLFYLMAVEDCSIFKQSHNGGYEGYRDHDDPGVRYLRAVDLETGKVAWEIPQVGAQEANYAGALSTAGGLVFYGETGGGFAAVDAQSGATLWTFSAGEPWKASPMTYMIGTTQYVAIASGSNILSFALANP